MDFNTFFLTVVATVFGALISQKVAQVIQRPKLRMREKQWAERKKVWEKRGDAREFMICGITIENELSTSIFPRIVANITDTKIAVLNKNGDLIVNPPQYGRWWEYELADSDNLFASNNVSPEQRKKINIAQGVSRNLVIAYWLINHSSYYLFTISSDKPRRFLSTREKFKGSPPYYVKIEINGENFNKLIRLHLFPDDNGDLIIKEIGEFPFRERSLYE